MARPVGTKTGLHDPSRLNRTAVAYRWLIRYEDPLMASMVQDEVLKTITMWMARWPKRYSNGWVRGSALGVLEVGIACHGSDKWAAQTHVRRFMVALKVSSKASFEELNHPETSSLPRVTPEA
jgi:hypothetical protein